MAIDPTSVESLYGSDLEAIAPEEYLFDLERRRRIADANRKAAIEGARLRGAGALNVIRPASGGNIVHQRDLANRRNLNALLQANYAGDVVRGLGEAEIGEIAARQRFDAEREAARQQHQRAQRATGVAALKKALQGGVVAGSVMQRYAPRDDGAVGPAPEEVVVEQVVPEQAATPERFLRMQGGSPTDFSLNLGPSYQSGLSNLYG